MLNLRQKRVTSLAKRLIDINERNPNSSRVGFKMEPSIKESLEVMERHTSDEVEDAISHIHKPGRGILLAGTLKSKKVLLRHGPRLANSAAACKHILQALRSHNLTDKEAERAGLPHNQGLLRKIGRIFFKGTS